MFRSRLSLLLAACLAFSCAVHPPGESLEPSTGRPGAPPPAGPSEPPGAARDETAPAPESARHPPAPPKSSPRRSASAPAAGSPASAGIRRIGLLFPARGRWKGFGLEAQRGAQLCLEDPERTRPWQLEPVVHEEIEGADPGAIIADLVDRQGVVALIGPLLSATVEKVLPAAERRALPVISPTAAAERLGTGSPVFFRTCLTLESFCAALADFTTARLDRPSFAIIVPSESYGRALSAAFRRGLEQRGAGVQLVREYSPGLRDLPVWAEALVRDLRHPGAPGSGPWSVDALFLAGTAQQAGMILPRLAYQGLDPRTLAVVGGSGLTVAEFPRLAGGYAEGALLADGFFARSEQPAARDFAQRFRVRHGVDPGAAAAQGCAAVEVLIAALRGGATDPPQTLAALGGLGAVDTVLGRIRLAPGGKNERRPFFITVKGGVLVELTAP